MKTSILLTAQQVRLLNAREQRSFVSVTTERALIEQVEAAADVQALERLAMQSGLCDVCDLTGADREAAVMLVKVIVKVSYRFPRIRSRFCFVGTRAGYTKAMQGICRGDRKIIDEFQIAGICSAKDLVNMACDALLLMNNIGYGDRTQNVLATAFSIYHLLDALVVDEADFSGAGYVHLRESLRRGELDGTVPRGCGRPASVIFHECGHLLDYICHVTEDSDFIQYYTSLGREVIERHISAYATTEIREFHAEAFAAYMSSPVPGEIARKVYAMTQEKYRGS